MRDLLTRRFPLLIPVVCMLTVTLSAQTPMAPFTLGKKHLLFNKTDSIYMCSVSDSLFAKAWHTHLAIDSAIVDTIWSEEIVIRNDSVCFPLVEGNKTYSLFLRNLNGDTLHAQLTFTSLPVVSLTGTFGYDYQQGLVTITMPSDEEYLAMAARLKWRGGTTNTAGKHKRNYKIKFLDEDGEKQDRSFFGFRNDDTWILNAGQVDLARCRNQIAHDLWGDMGQPPYYAAAEPKALTHVRGEFVEVLLNGDYSGIYSLTEPMDRKQMKLKKYDDDNQIIHGQLWKTVSWDGVSMRDIAPYDNNKDTWRGFETDYPDFDDVNPTDYSTLYNAISFLVNSTDDEFAGEVEEWFDVPVLLDYYIFITVLGARDNDGKNMYWGCYDKEIDKKLTLAVWDLDCTIGQNYTDTDPHPDTWGPYIEWTNLHYLLFRLKTVQRYQDMLLRRYKELRRGCLDVETLKQRYTAVIERFMRSGAAMRESERWSGDTDISGLTLDFEEELYFITDWIDKRIAFLDEGEFAPGIVTTIAYPFADKENAPCFNILGQPVSAPSQSGLYIIKGQKFFVR